MNFLSRSVSHRKRVAEQDDADIGVPYQSVLEIESQALAGVHFVINRISFGRRMELSRRVRELTQKGEFLQAGDALGEKIEAGILAQEVDAMYLRWGLVRLVGLEIDGERATAEKLLDCGPEALTREIIEAIKKQCGLSEAERKN